MRDDMKDVGHLKVRFSEKELLDAEAGNLESYPDIRKVEIIVEVIFANLRQEKTDKQSALSRLTEWKTRADEANERCNYYYLPRGIQRIFENAKNILSSELGGISVAF